MVDKVFLDVGHPSESVGNVFRDWFVLRGDDRNRFWLAQTAELTKIENFLKNNNLLFEILKNEKRLRAITVHFMFRVRRPVGFHGGRFPRQTPSRQTFWGVWVLANYCVICLNRWRQKPAGGNFYFWKYPRKATFCKGELNSILNIVLSLLWKTSSNSTSR